MNEIEQLQAQVTELRQHVVMLEQVIRRLVYAGQSDGSAFGRAAIFLVESPLPEVEREAWELSEDAA